MASPRPHQQKVLEYDGGTLGVSAVPGSGKTWTLTRLAARLVLEADLGPQQEVLVVTLVNASVDNFATRIGKLIEEEGLLPEVGYRVCTLHTLAHEIVRARPDLVRLSEDFSVIDERAGSQIITEAAQGWLRSHSRVLAEYLTDDMDASKRKWVLSQKVPLQVKYIAQNGIKHAKCQQVSPETLKASRHPLAQMVGAIYDNYQQALMVRSAIDFDDLIRYANEILSRDEDLRRRLRAQWPFILEDEAQDSSEMQERILRTIAGEGGNWVRVGDPNQAIYESFTTADPELLRDFLEEADEAHNLPASGRSQPSIIELANEVIRWSSEEHPVPPVQEALSAPYIQPTEEGDPQPNPPDRPDRIAFVAGKFSEEDEREKVARSLEQWIAANPEKTVAVLSPIRAIGMDMAEHFERNGIPYTDSLLKLTTQTRKAAHWIERIIASLGDPTSPAKLARAYMSWRYASLDEARREAERKAEESRSDGEGLSENEEARAKQRLSRLSELMASSEHVEAFLWPGPNANWLEEADVQKELEGPEDQAELEAFRERMRYWQELSVLPVGQLVMALAQDLFTSQDQLALAQKFAGLLRAASSYNPDWGLPQFADELQVIAENERTFQGLGAADTAFDPDEHTGKVTLTTMHGAKGMEWDRVHLVGVNDWHFPSAVKGDKFLPEKWFYRDDLNLQAEAMAQIDAAGEEEAYQEGRATKEAREEYARERLRLLYVGITRAREELVVTSNIGRFEKNRPAIPFAELKAFCEEELTADA